MKMTQEKTLKECFDLNNSDKSLKHRYDTIYEPHFKNLRKNPINILEIGIFKGDSIKAWLDYFPNASIYGVDIFERVEAKDIPILQNKRVVYAKGDSTKVYVKDWANLKFDIIIDDGLHTPDANRLTFSNFFPNCCGMYFIEDVWPLDQMTDSELQHTWVKNKSEYTLEKHNRLLKTLSKSGIVTHYDLRSETNQPDSYIIKVKR